MSISEMFEGKKKFQIKSPYWHLLYLLLTTGLFPEMSLNMINILYINKLTCVLAITMLTEGPTLYLFIYLKDSAH